MASNEQRELERLRRQLDDVTAERDRLLIQNRRLIGNLNGLQGSGVLATNAGV